jgi:SPX domain protein involved in polyphosphate accumulation
LETARYRHEYKYILSQAQILMEDAKINTIAELDSYVGEQGYYNIRSLYFDDYENSCFMANENGIDNREKYRIRIYNGAKERIKLELKQKCHGMTLKRNCGISLQQCEMLMAGRVPSDIKEDQQVLWKLAYLMETRLMMPKIIVDYDRIPYVYRPGDANVRITFDKNIKSINDTNSFLDLKVGGRGILPVGSALMEVKFDDFIPDEIYSLLQLNGLQVSTFSKYYLCRKFAR